MLLAAADAPYRVYFDHLDVPSNIDCGISVGTVFGST